MRLFIAEKPSLGRAIAEGLGNFQKQTGYIVCDNGTLVTWCFGHLLELWTPKDYDFAWKKWSKENLPIIPERFKLKPRAGAEKQLAILEHLISKADCIVNAGDPDREGQLLIDEVLEQYHYTGKVERIWLAALDTRSVARALATLEDNAKYAPLRDAARARSQADWLIGLNATRAMTILGQDSGRQGVLSLGRVQTPTLALVVERDRAIAAFKPHDYFTVKVDLAHTAGNFQAVFAPGENQSGLDEQGRLIDANVVAKLMADVQGAEGNVATITRQEKKKPAPLPHCLSSLQKSASASLGMTAQEVLDIAQDLYEKKLTTYPRTDCRFLPAEQFADAGRILTALAFVAPLEALAKGADGSLRSATWDTAKITAHHGIIPTGEMPSSLSDKELQLYIMICTAFILQFYPVYHYEAQKIAVDLAGTTWEAKGRLILNAGWTAAQEDEGDDAKEGAKEDITLDQALPAVDQGDQVQCERVTKLVKKTSPPARFTEGTLIEAMANIHRFVTDPKAKATLKENEGLGTEATRAGILETLKNRKFLMPDKKALISTPLGQQIIDFTPPSLKDPVTTAQWESKLNVIADGHGNLAEFMELQITLLPGILAPLLAPDAALPPAYPCLLCGQAMKLKAFPGKEPFWGCSGYPECKNTLPDDHGKPGKRLPPVVSTHKCPKCGHGLVRKNGKYGFFWGCSSYPSCTAICFDAKGAPDLSSCR